MTSYDRTILNALLDSYEKSLLSRGENKVTVHISFHFTRKTMPVYFDESSTEYEVIHAGLQELEDSGYIQIVWRNHVPGHIVSKVLLREEHAGEIYQRLSRTPRTELVGKQLAQLREMKAEYTTPVASAFLTWLISRIEADQPVKEYFDLADLRRSRRLVECASLVETNSMPCYYRAFSIQHFGDSKAFDEIRSIVKKIFCRFGEGFAEADEKAVFAEYNLYDTPDYVYLKGEGLIVAAKPGEDSDLAGQRPVDAGIFWQGNGRGENTSILPLNMLRQGIGISGEDLSRVLISGTERTAKVITIENLTTFFQWQEPCSLIIYLGGYHNHTRRRLLQMIYEQLPDAEYLHFGDIDAGGFEIFGDLCRKTGIPFQMYHMGIEELVRYRAYTKRLTANDRTRLKRLQEKAAAGAACREVIAYMLENGVKLEQECVQ